MSKITEKGPILVLPEDEARKQQLQRKLEEYKGRFDPYRTPELQMGTICKATILERLLRDTMVNTWELCLEMMGTYGSGFDSYKFDVACGVINDYCKTGGKHAVGGTGLPDLST